MHPQVLTFLDEVKELHPDLFRAKNVIEFGSYIVNGSVRSRFSLASRYTGVDWRAGPGVDVVSLAHAYQTDTGPVDLCISTEMLEHDPYWKDSLANMVRLLRDGGSLILTCASPLRFTHEVECAPTVGYYKGLTEIEIGQHLRELAEWQMLWVEGLVFPQDTHVLAFSKRADPTRPKTSVVLPCFNNAELAKIAAESLRSKAEHSTELIIVDNGSKDDESLRLRGLLPEVYMRYPEALGYPAATNRGIQMAAGQYIALCNNDIEMQTPNWDTLLIETCQSNLDLVSPVFDYCGNLDQIQKGVVPADTLPRRAKILFFVMVLCQRRLFSVVGLLDTRFGLGNSEDVDLCFRVEQQKGRLLVDERVIVRHEGHRTFEQIMSREQMSDLVRGNHDLLMQKWHGL